MAGAGAVRRGDARTCAEDAATRGACCPTTISRADAVFNLQRVALLLQAVQFDRPELLREALRDRWHQPYRAALVPGLAEALALEHPDLLGVCLSGSGPTVVALVTGETAGIEQALQRDIYDAARRAVPRSRPERAQWSQGRS